MRIIRAFSSRGITRNRMYVPYTPISGRLLIYTCCVQRLLRLVRYRESVPVSVPAAHVCAYSRVCVYVQNAITFYRSDPRDHTTVISRHRAAIVSDDTHRRKAESYPSADCSEITSRDAFSQVYFRSCRNISTAEFSRDLKWRDWTRDSLRFSRENVIAWRGCNCLARLI